ncbi:MAG: hypothetical protein IJ880_15425 [Bacilli bacterium]|nr:hypothetical protein [Bacilli bacterium]
MEEFNLKQVKKSLILNILIFIITVFSCYAMFAGIYFMSGDKEYALSSKNLSMFKYFTIDSNVLIAIASLIFAIEECKILKKKKIGISKGLYLLKLSATGSVGLTFLVTFAYLVPIVGYGFKAMIMNSNLFFHLITPLLAIFTFVLFEKTNKIGKKEVIVGIVPTACYAIYYLINIVTHMTDGKVSPEYDWYFFMQGGIWTAFIVVPLMLLITYLINLFLWKTNKTLVK